MVKGKGNTSRNLTQEIETTARESSHRHRGKVHRFLEKIKDGANKLRLRSRDSGSRSSTPLNVYYDERASSTPNLEVCSHTCPPVPALSKFWWLRRLRVWKWRLVYIPNRYFRMHNELQKACWAVRHKAHRRISMLLIVYMTHISNPSGYLTLLSGGSRMYIHM
ncbi:hypothetical protein BDR07DRAFT_372741 [Suillus spraguei]|nr:hypothetical protein BDR07DRAFT_372741 [Suillus spraguei]